MVNPTINFIHSSVFNGHLGKTKTLSKLIERFYRPFLKEDVKNLVRQCDICQRIKNPKYKFNAEILYLTPCRPNQIVTTDIAGPFKTTLRNNTHFQVVIDHFTKYIQIFPLQGTKTQGVANNIVNGWCCKFGLPESILSDGGKNYQSKLLELVYEYLDIQKLKTTPYHPQCDGQSERSIRTLKKMISAFVDVDQMTWDIHLEKFAFAYNTSVHAVTKQTPFELMFGRKPRLPIDIIIPNPEPLGRVPILKEYKLLNELGEITVLEDID